MYGSKSPMKKKKLTPKKKMKVEVKVLSPTKKSKYTSEEKDHIRKDDGEDQYVSDELGSSDPYAFEYEKLPKYENFRKEKLGKDYKSNMGMEFNSLSGFKDAIIEWSVLNGREITFVMKESNREEDIRAVEVPLVTGVVEVSLAIRGTYGTAEDGDGTLTQ
ncbi:hypothetical protein KIW84_052827 [Lathyrus oleraceus]|uniref:Uncharacterized protein n=1 Tax=Pisum sativum TaxID=3888 RepID=A0A9D4WR28_PEA|nr:hypothetical protein KIW84_052827 [Pisum sativum]